MKFLANENFPQPSVKILTEAGYQVTLVSELAPGISDIEVIRYAKTNKSIILTFDKDYGEIIFKYGKKKPPTVIFFRFKGDHPGAAGEILISLLKNELLIVENKFTVIEKENVRQRAYD